MHPCINILNNINNRKSETSNTAREEANIGYLQTYIGWRANPKKEYTTRKPIPSKQRNMFQPKSSPRRPRRSCSSITAAGTATRHASYTSHKTAAGAKRRIVGWYILPGDALQQEPQ